MSEINDIQLNPATFNPNPYWSQPIPRELVDHDFFESNKCVALFDQNGYDLCPTELEYLKYNEFSLENSTPFKLDSVSLVKHRNEKHYSLQQPWFTQHEKLSGYVLNHSMILERKAYSGEALKQLQMLARKNPLLNKVIGIQPKWGIDFSLDFVRENLEDLSSNYIASHNFPEGYSSEISSPQKYEVFEIFHYEWDGFSYEDANQMKSKLEALIPTINFDQAAEDLSRRKSEWFNLEFFEQSDWKCRYFGVPNERFKLVCWNKTV